jgi:UDP-GlcNAc:undecaprenyl-phosphate/decaprenyl-phosphate GlcNAc-1-phosphate transferase
LIKDLERIGLIRGNYRGDSILTGAGVFFLLLCNITWIAYLVTGQGNHDLLVRLLFLITLISLAGLIDDMLGKRDIQGFKGHFTSLLHGRLTTGAFKAIIGFSVVLLIMDFKLAWSVIIIRVGLILLITNLLNLFDLRPGRALKFFFIFSLLLLYFLPSFLIYIIPVYCLSIFYLPFELKGRVMLGDTGANMLGALLGFGYSYGLTLNLQIIILTILIILTLLSEKYSFSQLIGSNSFLNWLDQLGRE